MRPRASTRASAGGVADRLVGYEPDSRPLFARYEAWCVGGDDVPFSVGQYWRYAATVFDYIRRAMPTEAPGTCAPGEVYGLVAWILAENGIGARDAAMNAECSASTTFAVVLPHMRMLPAILRMIVPAVSDESRAGGTPRPATGRGRSPGAEACRGTRRAPIRSPTARRVS